MEQVMGGGGEGGRGMKKKVTRGKEDRRKGEKGKRQIY